MKKSESTARVTHLKKRYTRRPCNLCSNPFIMRSPFDRFCGTCKAEKDVFKFAEWLPNLPIAV